MRDLGIAPEAMMTRDAYGNLMSITPCPLHKAYTGQRAPRTDCDGCWRVYDIKHPEGPDHKRGG
jgi:hypothetical protein